ERRRAFARFGEQAPRDRPARHDDIEAFVAAYIVGGVFAAMDATVTEAEQDGVDVVRVLGVDEEVDVARGADDLVYGEREASDQRRRRFALGERADGLLDLVDEAGHREC